MKYISLLRGINVSGQKIINMADLKELYLRLGFEEVTTYIQSGNVIFLAEKTSSEELVRLIESSIFLKYNFDVPVKIVKVLKMKKIVAQNPFLKLGITDVKKLHVTFLEKKPDEELLNEMVDDPESEDKFLIVKDIVYLYCPNGYGKTKLTNSFFESKLKMNATTRNWKSVCKLVDLTR